jgi:hypothetical protein
MMGKYLVIYEEEEYRNCQCFDVTKIKHFASFSAAMDFIAELEAFGSEWDAQFDSLLEVKELQVERPVAKIKALKEKRKRADAEYKQKQIDQKEDREKAQLKKLKEKYG